MKNLYNLLLVGVLSLTMQQAKAQSEATFYTSMGSFTVDLTDTLTPITVDSFIARCAEKFYDGVIFHRVIDGFMIQGGGFTASGQKNPGYTIPDEFDPSLSNLQKTISMANAGPNTGSTQFFINLVDNTGLDYNKQPNTSKHAVFGIVTSNFSVVQNIGKTPTSGNSGVPPNKPLTDVVMDSVRITRFPADVSEYYTQEEPVNIYPNPANGSFNIDLPEGTTEVIIMNISGKVILKVATAQKTKLSVDMTGRSKGIYLVRTVNEQGSTYGRVVLQ